MDRQDMDSYLLIQNDSMFIKSEIDKIQNQISIYIQSKYQEAIFSQENYMPIGLTERFDKLSKQIEKEEEKQALLLIEIDQMKKQKESIQNTIKILKQSKQMVSPILVNDNINQKRSQMNAAFEKLSNESDGNRIQIKNQGLNSAIQRKRMLDLRTAQRLQKLIREEQIKIAKWKVKIQEMNQKIAFDQEKKQQYERNIRENLEASNRKLAEDHRSNLEQSIGRLSQYIRNNSEILPYIE